MKRVACGRGGRQPQASDREGTDPLEPSRQESWPLVVSFLIALPVVVWFAFGLARGTEDGEIRPILVLYLMAIAVILLALGGVLAYIRAWRDQQRMEEDPDNCGLWRQQSMSGNLDQRFDPKFPFGRRPNPPPREFSVGPGMSLHARFHYAPPKPKRRI